MKSIQHVKFSFQTRKPRTVCQDSWCVTCPAMGIAFIRCILDAGSTSHAGQYLLQHLMGARCCAKGFAVMISFHSSSYHMKSVQLYLFPFERWRNQNLFLNGLLLFQWSGKPVILWISWLIHKNKIPVLKLQCPHFGGCLWSHQYHMKVKWHHWWTKNVIVQVETRGGNIKFTHGSFWNSKLRLSIVVRGGFMWKGIISSWENTSIPPVRLT